jgi:O-antigen/teichoic acid export membrane protein
MRLSTKVVWNSLVQVVSKLLSTLFGLLAIALAARYLGASGFGRYSTVVAFASIFAIIADLGLTLVTSQIINKEGADETKILSNLFAFRLVSAVLIMLPAPFLALLMPYGVEVKQVIWLACFAFFLTALNQIFVGLFQKHLRTDKIAVAEVLSRLLMAILMYLTVRGDWGLSGVLWATAGANLLSFLLHWSLSRVYAPITWRFDKEIWVQIMAKSWPLLTTIILNLIYLKADIIILSLLKTEQEVGLYGAAYKIVDVLVSLPFMFAGILLPILVSHWSKGRKTDYQKVWQKFFDYSAMIVLPLVAGGIVLAEPIMRLVAGADFAGAGSVLRILMLAVGAVFMSCFYSHTMVSWEKQKRLIIYYLLTAVTALPLYLILINRYSYYGAAWATVYSEMAILAGSAWAVWREEHLRPRWQLASRALLAAGVMALVLAPMVAWLQSWWQTILAVLIGAIVYVLMAWYLGIISKKDWEMLANKNATPTINYE